MDCVVLRRDTGWEGCMVIQIIMAILNKKLNPMNHIELGREGERIAVQHLKSKKHIIRKLNYRFRRGEIDIISEFDNFLVATEVKTRNSRKYGSPTDAVSRAKQRQLIQVMHAFLLEEDSAKEVRFDVVSIILNTHEVEINHIEDAFYPIA
jgi:putative endonuclease